METLEHLDADSETDAISDIQPVQNVTPISDIQPVQNVTPNVYGVVSRNG